MNRFVLVIPLLMVIASHAFAETASEVPLTNPEVLEPPSREQGVSPSPKPHKTPDSSNPESSATSNEGPMTAGRMADIVKALDGSAVIGANGMTLTVSDVEITVIFDPKANRMRAFSAFRTLDGVDGKQLYRMMQANFDAALDARYAVAKGYVISVFIHPLAELKKDQLIEGIGQVVNLVKTFGTAYTSGAITFGGGDSRNLHRELIDELLKKGERI